MDRTSGTYNSVFVHVCMYADVTEEKSDFFKILKIIILTFFSLYFLIDPDPEKNISI